MRTLSGPDLVADHVAAGGSWIVDEEAAVRPIDDDDVDAYRIALDTTPPPWFISQVTNQRAGSTVIEEGKPLFVQIAEQVEDSIVDGSLAEEAKAPSTNELAAFFRINPATAAKGINMLVDKGVLHKRRGIGMFVAPGARDLLLGERRSAFADRFVQPLLVEARKLGLEADDVAALIRERASQTTS